MVIRQLAALLSAEHFTTAFMANNMRSSLQSGPDSPRRSITKFFRCTNLVLQRCLAVISGILGPAISHRTRATAPVFQQSPKRYSSPSHTQNIDYVAINSLVLAKLVTAPEAHLLCARHCAQVTKGQSTFRRRIWPLYCVYHQSGMLITTVLTLCIRTQFAPSSFTCCSCQHWCCTSYHTLLGRKPPFLR